MDLKTFLSSRYSTDDFENFICERFYGLEISDGGYTDEYLSESEKDHIQDYRYLGQSELDDGKEIGFFEFRSTSSHIENKRVGYNNILKEFAKDYILDGAIASFSHNESKVWRLSFVGIDYDAGKVNVTNLKRFTYVLGESIPIKTPLAQLKNLKSQNLNEIEKAFSVEALNDKFFKDYKELFISLNDYFLKNNFANFARDEENIRAFNKKLLGRITFLYFLQKKGWMGVKENWGDGDKNFLQNTFSKSGEKNFYEEYLRAIFFEGLNEDRRDNNDCFELLDCKMPFLNGGLFESKEFDKEYLHIDNAIFKNIFEIFSRYNFTIIEDLPHDSEVAVDPEMLGKVFENLLEDNYKSGKGAFYTPREIVHYMCKESIFSYLITDFSENEEAIRELVFKGNSDGGFFRNAKNARAVEQKIKSIKILDPAIGSGAFPMGLLLELVEILQSLNRTIDTVQAKIDIIERSIYGIDIDASAVEIAQLRFWLSIVVDGDEPVALPNLDYKIMAGNSLLETINGFDPLLKEDKRITQSRIRHSDKQTADDVILLMKDKFHKYFNEHSSVKKKEIYETIKFDVINILNKSIKKFEATSSLLEQTKKEQVKWENDFKIRSMLSKIIDDYNQKESTQELFFYKIYFKEVLDSGGFNIVIGNPPYLRVQGIDKDASVQYKEQFKSASGKYDLYVLFVEKGLSLLAKDGILNYIMPHKWINSAFGKGLREVSKDKLFKFISFGAYQVFNASTYTSLVWFRNSKVKTLDYVESDRDLLDNKALENYLFGLKYNNYTHIKNSELSKESWIFTDKKTYEILQKIKKQPLNLKDIFEYIQVGIQGMGDEIFYLKGKFENDNFIGFSTALDQEIILEKDIVKPILMGDNVKRYAPLKNDYFVIYPHYLDGKKTKPYEEGILKEKFPLTYSYLLNFKDELINKKIKYKTNKKYWYSLHRAREISLFEQEKILTPYLSIGGDMSLDKNFFYTNTKNYTLIKYPNIEESYKFYLAILNSKLFWFFIQNTGTVFRGGYFAYTTDYLSSFNFPKIKNQEDTKPLENLVDYIMLLKILDKPINKYVSNEHIVNSFEEVLDAMVYELYFKEEFESKDIEFIEYAKEDYGELKENDTEIVLNAYRTLIQTKNKIRNNLILIGIEFPDLILPIKRSI